MPRLSSFALLARAGVTVAALLAGAGCGGTVDPPTPGDGASGASAPSEPGAQEGGAPDDASALPISGLFATGVDDTGRPLPDGALDAHYSFTSNDSTLPGPSPIAIVNGVSWDWAPDTSASTWISAAAGIWTAAGDVFTYTTSFTLEDVDPTTATLSGEWACDDACTMTLNGVDVAAYPLPAWRSVRSFTVPSGSAFHAGTNMLAIVVPNSGGPSGLQIVSLRGSARAANTILPSMIQESELQWSGSFSWNGTAYDARWNNGATAVLTVRSFTEDSIVIERTDTPPSASAGMTAIYTGQMANGGHAVVDGRVTWTWPGVAGYPSTGAWSATW